jgi:acyl-CoA synthetase (AMP-forming)/AMP-acid ligase II
MLLRCYRDGSSPIVDGGVATGDLGAIGSDGSLIVHGRRDELIITGGENVFPTAVEAALMGHPGVAEVAVAGVPDLDWGERVVAWIIPTDSSHPPSLASIREFTAESLPRFMAPKELHIVDTLPTTSSGKLRRHQLSKGSQPHPHSSD